MRLRAHYYQQFDADFALEVPAEGFGGWQSDIVTLAPRRTAVVVMHAWDCGTREQYPGWHRCVEYIPRADAIVREALVPLLASVRRSPLRVYHVVGGGGYYRDQPGYRRAVELAGPEQEPLPQIEGGPEAQALQQFRYDRVFVGAHNRPDVERGAAHMTFAPGTEPMGDEGVAENAHQLLALCQADGIDHLIYTGFAINWCLLLSPGGMHDMSRRGLVCSTIREAVTAVENKETAREQMCKQIALWRVSLAFGFVFDLADVLKALGQLGVDDALPT